MPSDVSNTSSFALPPLSLRSKLILPFCLILVLLSTSLWLFAQTSLLSSSQRQADTLGRLIAAQTADSVTELVLANDLLSLNVILNQLARTDSVARVEVYNIDDQMIAAAGAPGSQTQLSRATYSAPVALQNSVAGRIDVVLAMDGLQAELGALRLRYALITLAGLVLALFTGLALAEHLARPLRALRHAFTAPDDAPLPEPLPEAEDDINLLVISGVDFLHAYRQERALLYGEDGMASQDSLGSGPLRCSLLCIHVLDLGQSLTLMNPLTLSRLLEECHVLLYRASRLCGGHLVNADGATVMVAFDEHRHRHASRQASHCARLFLALLAQQQQQHRQQGSPVLQASCGIHQGECLIIRAGHQEQTRLSAVGEAPRRLKAMMRHLQAGDIALTRTALVHMGTPAEQYHPASNDNEAEQPLHYLLGEPEPGLAQQLTQQCERLLHPDRATSTATAETETDHG